MDAAPIVPGLMLAGARGAEPSRPAVWPGEAKARETAAAYESFFLNQMIEHMTAGLRTDGPFGGGHGEGVFRSLLNDEYAKAITRSGGVGIADMVYRQMLRMQEVEG